jgi:uncharacterized membrane protein YfcA
MMDLPYSVAGLTVGVLVGLTGVGGGSLMTPVLVLGFGISPVVAVGTDLLFAAITKCGGVVAHSLKGNVDWRITGLLAAGSVPGAALAIVGLSLASPVGRSAHRLISTTLGAMLVLTALALAFRTRVIAWARSRADSRWIARHPRHAAVAIGAFIGVAVSLSSVGAGAIGVTALILLFPTLATTRIVGTDIAHAVPITLVAGIGHAILGNTNWGLLGALLIGSLPGIFIGSHLAARLPERLVRHSLIAVLLLAGGKLVSA